MKKNRIITIAALLLSLVVGIGFAFAYFTDYEAARGGAIIHLGGQTELIEQMDGNNKKISVKNTGQTDMIVRVMIFGDESKMTVTAPDDWYKGDDGAYYYKKILHGSADGKHGDSTSTIHAEIKVTGDDATQNFDTVVVHEGSQAVYDGTKLAVPKNWNAEAVSKIAAE